MPQPKTPLSQIADPRLRAKMEIAVAQLPICQRTINFLDGLGIVFVHDLLFWEEAELLAHPHFGRSGMKEIYAALELIGFKRADEVLNAEADRESRRRRRGRPPKRAG